MGSRSPHSTADDEESEDQDAYNVEEEVRAAKILHEEDEISPIVPAEYLTVDKLVEDQEDSHSRYCGKWRRAQENNVRGI